jgi:hypothetical protein
MNPYKVTFEMIHVILYYVLESYLALLGVNPKTLKIGIGEL